MLLQQERPRSTIDVAQPARLETAERSASFGRRSRARYLKFGTWVCGSVPWIVSSR
jgi:hypothetical protein